MERHHACPVVMVIGGNDPVGGAGLCADIQALTQLGCHAAPVITALTTQTTCGVKGFTAVDAGQVREQVACVMQDLTVSAIKTGMLATPAIVEAVADCLQAHPEIPVVVDPVLASNRGDALSEQSLGQVLLERLAPHASIMTPNLPEFEALALTRDIETGDAAARLAAELDLALLVTGAHRDDGDKVINRLYLPEGGVSELRWTRLVGEFHGSGCTLASALAAGLSQGLELEAASDRAQAYTWQALDRSRLGGRCQHLPDRVHGGTDR